MQWSFFFLARGKTLHTFYRFSFLIQNRNSCSVLEENEAPFDDRR